MLREHGAIIVDGIQQASSLRCPHCGGHFLESKGNLEVAKRTLGDIARPKVFCSKCDRLTCGRSCCDPQLCVPTEARLEHAEGKKTTYDAVIEDLAAKGAPLL